jgi:hypothetical protein
MSFAGVELINNDRARAYAEVVGIDVRNPAPDLAASLLDDPYVDPVTDDAVWVDPSLPESGRFYGLAGLEFDGAEEGTGARQWTELLSDGGVPGARRRRSNEIEVRAFMFAADDVAMTYGLGWLASALRGSVCASSCTGDELCVYAAKPIAPRLLVPTPDGEPCGALTGTLDPTWDPVIGSANGPGGDKLVRKLFNVATIEGPTVTARAQIADGLRFTVRWLMKAGTPFWYREPTLVASSNGATGPSDPLAYQDTIPDYDPWGWRAECPDPAPCLDFDPFCVDPPAPPLLAPAPPDPCFPSDPRNNPPGEPDAHKFTAGRTIFRIPRGAGPDWLETVPVIRLYTGDQVAQRLIIRWYDNPRDVQCGTWLDPCSACAEINVVWLPRWSQLTIDGRVQKAFVECPGANMQEPRLYGPSGGPMVWPVFECSTALCFEIILDTGFPQAQNSWMDVHLASRSDVI